MSTSNSIIISLVFLMVLLVIGGGLMYSEVLERMSMLEEKLGSELSKVSEEVATSQIEEVTEEEPANVIASATLSATTSVSIVEDNSEE